MAKLKSIIDVDGAAFLERAAILSKQADYVYEGTAEAEKDLVVRLRACVAEYQSGLLTLASAKMGALAAAYFAAGIGKSFSNDLLIKQIKSDSEYIVKQVAGETFEIKHLAHMLIESALTMLDVSRFYEDHQLEVEETGDNIYTVGSHILCLKLRLVEDLGKYADFVSHCYRVAWDNPILRADVEHEVNEALFKVRQSSAKVFPALEHQDVAIAIDQTKEMLARDYDQWEGAERIERIVFAIGLVGSAVMSTVNGFGSPLSLFEGMDYGSLSTHFTPSGVAHGLGQVERLWRSNARIDSDDFSSEIRAEGDDNG